MVTIGSAAPANAGASAQANGLDQVIMQAIFGFNHYVLTDKGDSVSGNFHPEYIEGGAGPDTISAKAATTPLTADPAMMSSTAMGTTTRFMAATARIPSTAMTEMMTCSVKTGMTVFSASAEMTSSPA